MEVFDQLRKEKEDAGIIVENDNFLMPDMGDYAEDDMTLEYMEAIANSIGDSSEKEDKDAMFYIEPPFSEDLGYHEDQGVFVIKAKPAFSGGEVDYIEDNSIDGDTLAFEMSSIIDGDLPFEKGTEKYSSVTNYMKKHLGIKSKDEDGQFEVRFLGLDAPELPHYMYVTYEGKDKIKKLKASQLKTINYNQYMFDKNKKRDPEDIVYFIKKDKFKSEWHEVVRKGKNPTNKEPTKKERLRVIRNDGSPFSEGYAEDAKKVRDEVIEKIKSAKDIRIVLDAQTISKNSFFVRNKSEGDNFYDNPLLQVAYPKESVSRIYDKYMVGNNKGSGYNGYGMDVYRRFLGVVYIKMPEDGAYKGEWINLSKYAISQSERCEALPDFSGDPFAESKQDFASDAFKLWTYDMGNKNWLDKTNMNKDDLDDRKKMQHMIMGKSLDSMLDWTVMIGDNLFMVPPTSIRVINQTEHSRVNLLRAKGAMTKSSNRTNRLIEMTLYFNEEEGINGVPIDKIFDHGFTEDENGNKENIRTTYHMNGLRSLIAMFKFTPFLPVENKYLNETLNIDAVTLSNIQITTTPNYPKCISAVLTLQDFDYRVYMPELPVPDADKDESLNKNMFAATINYEAMRYYYQKCINNGERIKDLDFNSHEYLVETLGENTALQPMTFESSDLDFYVIDEQFLKEKMKAKIESMNRTLQQLNVIHQEQREYVDEYLLPVFGKINERILNDDFLLTLDKIMKDHLNREENFVKGKGKVLTGKFQKTAIAQITDLLDSKLKDLNIDYTIKTKTKNIKNESEDNKDANRSEDSRFRQIITFKVKNEGLSNVQIDEILQNYSQELGLHKDQFKKREVVVTLEALGKHSHNREDEALTPTIDGLKKGHSFSSEDEDYKLVQYLAHIATLDNSKTSGEIMQEDLLKKQRDEAKETATSLKFNKYPIGDVKIKSIAAVFGNNFSNIDLQLSDGYAPQYVGGQDTAIEVQIETMDENAVRLINHLPKLASMYTREYREVLNVYPLRIDSEITRLMGVNEVVVESVDISTVPQFPGLYNIAIRMLSVDRTLRNKESLTKVDKPDNAGATTTGESTTTAMKDFFDLKKSLAESEIYPDLELPSVMELERFGFKFIKYSNKNTYRKYPDPDFYFYYGHVLGNQIFRETILQFLNENADDDQEFEMSDIEGAQINIKPSSDGTGFNVTQKNNIALAREKDEKNTNKAWQAMNKLIGKDKPKDFEDRNKKTKEEVANVMLDASHFERWDIADTIKCHFREKKYDQMFEEDNEEAFFKKNIEKLSKNIIEVINKELNQSALKSAAEFHEVKPVSVGSGIDKLETSISTITSLQKAQAFADSYFNKSDGVGQELLKLIMPKAKVIKGQVEGLDIVENIVEDITSSKTIRTQNIGRLLFSIACARTGQKEYENDKKSLDWQPAQMSKDNIPYCVIKGLPQDLSKSTLATSIEDAVKNGHIFGPGGIKAYTKETIEPIIGMASESSLEQHFIDPYYRSKSVTQAEIDEYKRYTMSGSHSGAYHALMRESLYWMKVMLEDNILISLYDIISEDAIDVLEEVRVENNMDIALSVDESPGAGLLDKGMIKLFDFIGNKFTDNEIVTEDKINQENYDNEESQANLFAAILEKDMVGDRKALMFGKLFICFIMAATNGDKAMYSMVANREYQMLNDYVVSVKRDKIGNENYDEGTMQFRRYIRALVGSNMIRGSDKIGHSDANAKEEIENIAHKSIMLSAAEEPKVYLGHSFYDMIMNDKRGRMARAFPTYYMMLIDEGREIGYWKLHDNFYNMSAISEFQIVKSRKIAADTASLTMSNMYNSFDKVDDNTKVNEEYTYKDAFQSIFSPQSYAGKEQRKRSGSDPIASTMLRPGIRIHLRLGYGSNASTLPVLFNGVIAEVGTGESIQIVAQGDGIELTNPIMSNSDAEDVQHEDKFVITKVLKDWYTKGATPRTILTSLLTSEGTFLKSVTKRFTDGRLFNNNPYGIEHFGDKNFKRIFSEGEVVQNIYEAMEQPSWGDKVPSRISAKYVTDDAPRLSTQVFGKSYWDIMHICASASPDFISSIVPFQYRSSIFHGQPRYYYAYDYQKSADGYIREKRKPFQQHHIYSSHSDIISNNITVSDRDVKTCAVGLYQLKKTGRKMVQAQVGPMYVDIDIYPEKQKTMVVDTSLMAKGTIAGDAIPFLNVIQDNLADSYGNVQSGKKIAWRMTVSELKNSIKEMYKGEIIVLGDPSVKPYDKVWLQDLYERMSGCVEVEAVVQNFSIEEGFVTSVYPDCIATVDDRHERIAQSLVGSTIAKSLGAYGAVIATTWGFARNTKPLLTSLTSYANSLGFVAEDHINTIMNLIGKDDIAAEKFLGKIRGIQIAGGMSHGSLSYNNLMRGLNGWGKGLSSVKDITKITEMSAHIANLNKSVGSLNTNELLVAIEETSKDLKKGKGLFTSAKSGVTTFDGVLNKTILEAGKNIGADDIKALDTMLRTIQSTSTDVTTIAEVKGIREAMKATKLTTIKNPKDLDLFSRALKFSNGQNNMEALTKSTGLMYEQIRGSKELISGTETLMKNKSFSGIKNKFSSLKSTATGNLLLIAAEIAITIIITKTVNEYIERLLENLQVLQVFPLKKNGRVLTAGLDGSKGLVIGSPTEHQQGIVTTWAGKIFGNSDGMFESIPGFLTGLFATPKMRELGQKYRGNNGMPLLQTGDGLGSTSREHLIQDLLRYKSADELRKRNSYYQAAIVQPRLTDIGNSKNQLSEEGKVFYNKNSIRELSNIGVNKKITEEMVYINDYIPFEEFFRNEYLTLEHQEIPESKDLPRPVQKEFALSPKTLSIKCIEDVVDGKKILDIPFLNEDAIYLIEQILKKTRDLIHPEKKQKNVVNNFKTTPILINSALRAGENSLASTGYHFRITSPIENKTETILESLLKEQQEIYNIYSDGESKYFKYIKTSNSGGTPVFDITVFPTKKISDHS